jgi:hypothetical protein
MSEFRTRKIPAPSVGDVIVVKYTFSTGSNDFTENCALECGTTGVVLDSFPEDDFGRDFDALERVLFVCLFPDGIIEWGTKWEHWDHYLRVDTCAGDPNVIP